MKYLIPAVLLCAVSFSSAVAQSYLSFDEYIPDNQYSPFLNRVPYEYSFLLNDDHSKALFNPAYSAFIENSQVYLTVDPGSGKNVRVSGISAGSLVWGISARNRYDDTESVRNNRTFETRTNISGVNRSEFFFDRTSIDNNFSKTTGNDLEFRIAKIISGDSESSRAIGFRLAYSEAQQLRDQYSQNLTNDRTETYRNDTLIATQNANLDRQDFYVLEDAADRVYASLDYYSYKLNSESIHRLILQKGFGEFNQTRRDDDDLQNSQIDVEAATQTIINQLRMRLDKTASSSSPLTFGYDGYQKGVLGWLGNDYWFVSAHGTYSSHQSEFEISELESIREVTNSILTRNENESSQDSYSYDNWRIDGRISAGYAVTIESEDLRFFTGLNPYFNFRKSEFGNIQPVGLYVEEQTIYRAGGRIPIFGSIQLSEFVSIWGGGNINAYYNYTLSSFILEESFDPDSNVLRTYEQQTDNNRVDVSQTTFIGLKATHKSGLMLIADLNGDLAAFSGWLITVGYSF